MNHCFDDVERFMAHLQQVAKAQHLLSQKTKKRSKKSNKQQGAGGEEKREFLSFEDQLRWLFCVLGLLSWAFPSFMPCVCWQRCDRVHVENK